MRRIIVVLFAAVLAACLVTVFFLWNFGPNGNYQANAVLMEADVLKALNYNDLNPKTGSMDRFVFDGIELEILGEKPIKVTLPLAVYSKFYELIAKDKSKDVSAVFNPKIVMSLFVRTESPAAWQADRKKLQELQLSEEGLFRVDLREQNNGSHWVYFDHPGLYQKLLQLIP